MFCLRESSLSKALALKGSSSKIHPSLHVQSAEAPGHPSLNALHFDVQVSTKLLAPICPHTCEHVWRDLLKLPGSCLNSGWPQQFAPDGQLKAMEQYLARTVKSVRDAADKAVLPPKAKKGKAPTHQPQQVCEGSLLPSQLPAHMQCCRQSCAAQGQEGQAHAPAHQTQQVREL